MASGVANNSRPVFSRQQLLAAFAFAVVVRLLYWAFVAPHLFSAGTYIHADTASFVAPGLNLNAIGTYTSDPEFRDGLFTRVPGYALLLWMLGFFTSNLYPVVAAFQVALDSLTAVLLFVLAGRLGGRWAGWTAGSTYAAYPFALWWMTLTIPDVVTTFLAVLGMLVLTRERKRGLRDAAIDGIYLAVATLTREYLVLLAVPAAVAWMVYIPTWDRRVKTAVVAGFCGILVYAPWPLRNLINHDELIIFRASSSGYRQYAPDMFAAVDWMTAWTPDQGVYLDRVARDMPLDLPEHVLLPEERTAALALFAQARTCGTGIRLWGGQTEPENPCNEALVEGFGKLKKSYIQRHPIRWMFEVPLENLHKTVFKADLMRPSERPLVATLASIAFGYRTLLILLGLAGAWLLRRHRSIVVMASFSITVYLFMACYIRGLQMRYLLQADVVMLVPAVVLLVTSIRSRWIRVKGTS